jgi:hypothetical protein
MPHAFEPAASGRSKCRGCGRALEKGEIRFGERMANPFAEGTELTLWFHPMCAAYKRPESMLEALEQTKDVPGGEALATAARASLAHRRLSRLDGAERAKGQAICRHCREPIPRGEWRIRLVFFEEGRFNPGGFIHLGCSRAYFETDDLLDRVLHFSRDLSADDRQEISLSLGRG